MKDEQINLTIRLPLTLETLDAIEAEQLDRDPGLPYRAHKWPGGSPVETFGEPLHAAIIASEWRFG
jgi:hypothetical protein